MYTKTARLLVFLVTLGLIGIISCHSSETDFLQPQPGVKIIVKGLKNTQIINPFEMHISGVNLEVSNDIYRTNYFSVYHSFHDVNDLVNGIDIEEDKLSEGKWRIAIELIGWKTACSILLEDNKNKQLIFDFQKDNCF